MHRAAILLRGRAEGIGPCITPEESNPLKDATLEA